MPNDRVRLQVKTRVDPEVWEDVGADAAGVPVPVYLETGDIQIGAIEIKDATTDIRAIVNGFGYLMVDGSGATQPISGTITTGVDSVIDSKFYTNHIDDYTTSNVTYFGQENKDGTWRIIKIDETGNFPVFTYATVTNNPTLTSYTLAWNGRVTATYNIYATAF